MLTSVNSGGKLLTHS